MRRREGSPADGRHEYSDDDDDDGMMKLRFPAFNIIHPEDELLALFTLSLPCAKRTPR